MIPPNVFSLGFEKSDSVDAKNKIISQYSLYNLFWKTIFEIIWYLFLRIIFR